MPLVTSDLSSEIEAVFASMPPTGAVAAQKLAQAYDNYCKKAMAGPGVPVFTTTEVSRLKASLAGALASSAGAAPVVAQAWSTGIMQYWTTPPVPFVGGPAAGVVVSMPGAPAVTGPITAALSNLKNTAASCAAQIAAALDVATKTVLVTYSTPQPTPPPPATVV